MNAYQQVTRTSRQLMPLIQLCTAISILSSITPVEASGENEENVRLFIPIVSSKSPDLDAKLTQALRAQGINKIIVENVDFWHPYQQGLKKGRKGIYFAQPHFAAWAINRHDFKPIYKLHGSLKYVLAARRSDTHIFEVSDLDGKTICREPGLNLGTVWLNRLLGALRLNARIKEQSSIALEMQKPTSNCTAFVIEDYAYERLNKASSNHYIRLEQSEIFKHYAFISHPSISKDLIQKIQKALKSNAIKSLLKPYFSDLSKWQNLLPIKADDYSNNDYRLLNAYWGNSNSKPETR